MADRRTAVPVGQEADELARYWLELGRRIVSRKLASSLYPELVGKIPRGQVHALILIAEAGEPVSASWPRCWSLDESTVTLPPSTSSKPAAWPSGAVRRATRARRRPNRPRGARDRGCGASTSAPLLAEVLGALDHRGAGRKFIRLDRQGSRRRCGCCAPKVVIDERASPTSLIARSSPSYIGLDARQCPPGRRSIKTIVSTALPTIVGRPVRAQPSTRGWSFRLHPHLDGLDAAVRQARRSLRAQTPIPVRDHHLLVGVGARAATENMLKLDCLPPAARSAPAA